MKALFRCIAFLACLVILLGIFSRMFLPKNNTYEDGIIDFLAKGYLGEPEQSLDVLILGDSVPRFAICPPVIWKEQGIPSYVCSGYARSLPYILPDLKQFFQTQSPRIVVLETDILFRSINLDTMFSVMIQDRFPVFQYHNNWKLYRPTQLLRLPNYNSVTWEKGYYLWKDIVPWTDGDYMAPSNEKEPLNQLNVWYFEKILSFCSNYVAKLLLVSAPSPQNMSSRKHNTLQALAEQYSLPYLDMNEKLKEIGIDWEYDTPDRGDHLNWWGAQKVSGYLASWLMETGLLTNRKGESGYDVWDSSCNSFFDLVDSSFGNTDYDGFEE